MRGKISQLLLLALIGGLVACGSAPSKQDWDMPTAHFDPGKDPYWEDARWDKVLLDTVQAAVHDPVDPSDMSAPGLHATVKFTYLAGALEYPEIVTSTGNSDMDKLMLHQLASIQVPQPTSGLQTDTPHEFVLDLDMPTPLEKFQSSLYAAIDYQKIYPKDPILSGTTGDTAVDFDYLDGKASNVVMTSSSKDKELDGASIHAVMKAALPAPPIAYAGKSMHLRTLFCYTLATNTGIKNPCPAGRNVILVQGTRIVRTTVERGR